jgi:predicted ATP-dependent endonuclease of OLD family
MYGFISSFLTQSIIIFSEFRERPNETDRAFMISQEKMKIATTLSNLKNGTIIQKHKFEDIQDSFSKLFPTLKLETTGFGEGASIVIEVNNGQYEIPYDQIGSGIFEIISIITHLFGTKQKLLVLDEPEIHLHPHAQRMLSTLIKEYSSNNQTICITHSPYLVTLERIENVTIVRNSKGHSELIGAQFGDRDHELKRVINRIMTNEQKEFLFSRCVLLVEGETEFGAMPIISKKMGKNLDDYGISVIPMGGNKLDSFGKLLKAFNIPFYVMTDKDTLTNLTNQSLKIDGADVKTSSLIVQLSNLDKLATADLDLIKSCEEKIQKIKIEKCNKVNCTLEQMVKSMYSTDAFDILALLVKKHNVLVLSSDFEGVYVNAGNVSVLNDARSEYPFSKVLQGQYIAENCTIPKELQEIVSLVSSN